jgi:hypothetical protein
VQYFVPSSCCQRQKYPSDKTPYRHITRRVINNNRRTDTQSTERLRYSSDFLHKGDRTLWLKAGFAFREPGPRKRGGWGE